MAMTLRVPGDAKWDCHACGACCRFYDLGPVEPGIIANLEAEKIGERWPRAKDGFFHVRKHPDGREMFFLNHIDGKCVFLRDDNLCAVHGMLGADKKPSFCREYPFHLVQDPKGLVAVVRPSCEGFHASSADGKPYEDMALDVARLPRVVPIRRFAPGEVVLWDGAVITVPRWMEIEAELLGELTGRADADPLVPVRIIRDRLRRELGVTITPDPRRAQLAAGAVVEALRRLLEQAANDPNAEKFRKIFAEDGRDLMKQALPRMDRLPVFDPHTAAWWNLLLRQFLLAKGFQAAGSVMAGLGQWAVLARLIGAAAEAGPDGVRHEDAGPIVSRYTKITENSMVAGVLKKAGAALVDVVDG